MEQEGKWEEQIRSKLYDYEADTYPEDWDAIASKLGGGKIVHINFYRRLTYIASAAAVIALLIVGGVYLFSDIEKTSDQLAIVENTQPSAADDVDNVLPSTSVNNSEDVEIVMIPDNSPVDKAVDNLLASTGEPTKQTKSDTGSVAGETVQITVKPLSVTALTLKPLPVDEITKVQKTETDEPKYDIYREIEFPNKSYLADVKRRRWSFGMGGGGYAIGATTGVAPVSTSSGVLSDDEYMQNGNRITVRNGVQNSTLFDPIEGLDNNNWLGKVKYQLPISAGLGINYHLTDRWALQSGLVYTLLRSKGKYMDIAGNIGERKQYLHFIGIPLSASYSIAEWNRIRFYITAGGMGELNFTGKKKEIITVENLETIESEKMRMKEPLWSVHTRAGADYPLWKFIHVYAETGVSYYFNNKSAVETLRSDQPLNVSLQAGIRLGF